MGERGIKGAIQVFMGWGRRTGGSYTVYKYLWVGEGGLEGAIQVFMGGGERNRGSYTSIYGFGKEDWRELFKYSRVEEGGLDGAIQAFIHPR